MITNLSTKKKVLIYFLLTLLTALPNIEALIGMSLTAIGNNEKNLIIFDSLTSLIVIIILAIIYKKKQPKKNKMFLEVC